MITKIKKALRKIIPKNIPIMYVSDKEFEQNLKNKVEYEEKIINEYYSIINEVAMQQASSILDGLKKEDIKVYINGKQVDLKKEDK